MTTIKPTLLNQVVRFFLTNGRYMGCKKIHHDTIYEIQEWLSNGHVAKIGKDIVLGGVK